MAEISTIFVGGFPPDTKTREMDNLCRFFPGFVSSNSTTGKGFTLFALFDSAYNAQNAITMLNGQTLDRSVPGEPLRASMARNNMKRNAGAPQPSAAPYPSYPSPRGNWGGGALPNQPPPPAYAPPPGHGAADGGKRPRMYEDPSQVDTVASVGAVEAGFDEDTLRAFFEACPGFVDFKANPRSGGGFAKFVSPALASQCVQMARSEGIPCDMAKSSMSSTSAAGQQSAGVYAAQPRQPETIAPSAKRPRIYEDPSDVDTVASVGAAEAGFDEDALRVFFEGCGGFLEFKPNPRSGGGFAKFASNPLAQQAVQMANDQGIPCEMAKSSMGTAGGGGGGRQATAPVYGNGGGGGGYGGGGGGGSWQTGGDDGPRRPRIPEDPGQVDTVASVGAAEVGYDEHALRLFFQAQEGFVAFKGNPRMGGGFAKFQNPTFAVQAVQASKDAGVPAAIARSSMSVT